METLKFKSTIKCTGCLENVTPYLNDTQGVEKWDVDLNSPERVLTVHGEALSEKKITESLQKAGYSAERIK